MNDWTPLLGTTRAQPSEVVHRLLVGTREGLWMLATVADRRAWWVSEPAFLGHIVTHAVLDPRDQRRLVAADRRAYRDTSTQTSDEDMR